METENTSPAIAVGQVYVNKSQNPFKRDRYRVEALQDGHVKYAIWIFDHWTIDYVSAPNPSCTISAFLETKELAP
jgi:hypothetical protein